MAELCTGIDGDRPAVFYEHCLQRRVLRVLDGKWNSMVLHALSFGPMRTGALQRSLEGISKKMLTQTLREMERDGLLTRTIHEAVPPHVEYALTPLGHRFEEPLAMLYDWARANAGALDELDRNRGVGAAP
jgi:DNA-binding HxlR family transcriptional regulator